MITSLMLYGVAVSVLACLIAFLVERCFAITGRPRRCVWIAALVASLAFPALRVVWVAASAATPSVPTWEIGSKNATAQRTAPGPDLQRSAAGAVAAKAKAKSARSADPVVTVSWPSLPRLDGALLALCWLSPTAMIALLALNGFRLRRAARKWPLLNVDGEVVLVAPNLGPAVIGFLDAHIVLPQWLLDSTRDRRTMVLAHEREHLVACDQLLLLAGVLCVSVAPWNPLLWWQLARLRFAIEVDCDARVLRRGTDPHRYGEMLLAVSQRHARAPLTAVALTERSSHLERRIRIMLQPSGGRARLLVVAFIATAAACAAVAAGLDAPRSAADSTLLFKPGFGGEPPGLRKLLTAAQSRYPELEHEPLTGSVLITMVLNVDGTVRLMNKEDTNPQRIEPSDEMQKRLERYGLTLKDENPALVSMVRMRTEAAHTVDLLIMIPPYDRAVIEGKVKAAVLARYPTLRPDQLHLVTVIMNADGTPRRVHHETLRSPDDSRDLPKFYRLSALGVPESELGFVGFLKLPAAAGIGDNVFVQYAWPRNDRDSLFPSLLERERIQRGLIERHFPDLVREGAHAHELAWLLLDHDGQLVSTGRTPLGVEPLVKEIEARDPAYTLDSYRIVRRLRTMFDTAGVDVVGQPVTVAFLWLDQHTSAARSSQAAGPNVGRYTVDATVYRNGEKVSTKPVSLEFGQSGRIDVPGQLRVNLNAVDIGEKRLLMRVEMQANERGVTAEFADRWQVIAAAGVPLDPDKPWRMGPSHDVPRTATDEGGWVIELTLHDSHPAPL